jgi:hypothetical protein
MPRVREESDEYKDVLQAIADHGSEVVEVLEPQWSKHEKKTIKKERILIVLEMFFQKAVYEGNISAGQQYLDRLLGKPKESLKLTNGSDAISKLSDEELTDKITRIIAATGEGAAGKSD